MYLKQNGNAVDDGVAYEVTSNCSAKSAAIAFEDEITEEASMNAYLTQQVQQLLLNFLSETNHTSVVVYNTMGSRIAVLFDGVAESGHINKIKFDGSNLPKGLYYIRLQSGNSVNEIKKLLLTR